MTLARATLVPNTSQPVGEGLSGAVRALVRLDDGQPVIAICKRLPRKVVFAECFAALLLRGWGISVPQPVLVADGQELLFGSLDVGYPNLRQKLGLAVELPPAQQQVLLGIAAALIASWPQTPTVIAADEAIQNIDRHVAQILWDGSDTPWWVDHDRCLGLVTEPDSNKLAALLTKFQLHSDVQRKAMAQALSLADNAAQEAAEYCDQEADEFLSFVKRRLPQTANLVLRRFPQPNDLLSNPTS
ncbi:hypothetical protein [Chitiniphilus eburneus]|uniref:hypothetical protein n=1 Tax=Chitiniphilus eburneus TaxID=2571148 RepID=UPI0035CEFF87